MRIVKNRKLLYGIYFDYTPIRGSTTRNYAALSGASNIREEYIVSNRRYNTEGKCIVKIAPVARENGGSGSPESYRLLY